MAKFRTRPMTLPTTTGEVTKTYVFFGDVPVVGLIDRTSADMLAININALITNALAAESLPYHG